MAKTAVKPTTAHGTPRRTAFVATGSPPAAKSPSISAIGNVTAPQVRNVDVVGIGHRLVACGSKSTAIVLLIIAFVNIKMGETAL